MKLNQFQQYLVLAAIAVLGVIGAYYYFLIKPLDTDIVALRGELDDKQKKLEAAKQTVAKYDEFKKRSAAVTRQLEWAQSRIPVQLDKLKFIESINVLQTRSRVSLVNFKFKGISAPSKDGVSEVQADVKLNGNFVQLLNFLYEISLSKNLMVVHDLKIIPNVDQILLQQTVTAQMTLGGLQGKK